MSDHEWLKLPVYLYDVCTVFSQGRCDCSNGVYPIGLMQSRDQNTVLSYTGGQQQSAD